MAVKRLDSRPLYEGPWWRPKGLSFGDGTSKDAGSGGRRLEYTPKNPVQREKFARWARLTRPCLTSKPGDSNSSKFKRARKQDRLISCWCGRRTQDLRRKACSSVDGVTVKGSSLRLCRDENTFPSVIATAQVTVQREI